jgi:hypothetical protein
MGAEILLAILLALQNTSLVDLIVMAVVAGLVFGA